MPSTDELWSPGEVKKLLKLFGSNHELASDIIEALPYAAAVVHGADLQVAILNSAFEQIIERVAGFAGSHARTAEKLLGEPEAKRTLSTALGTGTPQRNARLTVGANERLPMVVYPVGREQLLVLIDASPPSGAGQAAASDAFAILQALPVPVYTCDTQGKIRYANRALERLTGRSLPELLSINTSDLHQAAEPTDTTAGEVRTLTTRTGTVVRVAAIEAPTNNPGEFVVALRLAGEESKKHEKHAVMEALEALSGQVAHQFNNMLTIVLSYADIVEKRFGSVGSLRHDISQIVEAGTKAAELTSQLLTFSRGRPGERTRSSVNDVLGEFRSLLQGAIRDEIELVMDLESGVPDVLMSPKDLETLLLNLVTNANEAIDGPGTITVSTRRGVPCDRDLPEEHASHNWTGDTVTISVRDNGRGIPPDLLDVVFHPFVTSKRGGSGLGLSVVHGIVKNAGGIVSIASKFGQGTTAWVTLPAVARNSTP